MHPEVGCESSETNKPTNRKALKRAKLEGSTDPSAACKLSQYIQHAPAYRRLPISEWGSFSEAFPTPDVSQWLNSFPNPSYQLFDTLPSTQNSGRKGDTSWNISGCQGHFTTQKDPLAEQVTLEGTAALLATFNWHL
jgi:hypothetical protein